MNVVVTEKAKSELAKLGCEGKKFLRVEVAPGGCSGMTYSAAIDDELKDQDKLVIQDDALRIYADGGSLLFLDGLEIDFSDDLVQSGFRFKNPKAKKSCGCGASFQV